MFGYALHRGNQWDVWRSASALRRATQHGDRQV